MGYMHTPETFPDPSDIQTVKEWLGAGSINFFGMPLAGKDIQANRIQSLVGGAVLGGGAILRNSVIPKHVQNIMNNGELIPTDEYVRIVLPYLSSDAFAGSPLLLSAVGRWHGEEQSVIDALEQSGHPLKAVVHLRMPEEAARERLNTKETRNERGSRADDTPEVIEKRIVEFTEKTLPVIDFYREHGLLIEVDATNTKDGVTAEIMQQLGKKALIN